MTDELWTVSTAHKRRRFVHNAHSPGDDGVRHFSIVKWVLLRLTKTSLLPQRVSPTRVSQDDTVGSFSTVKWGHFRLSKFTLMGQSGFIFDCQTGSFSLDKNSPLAIKSSTEVKLPRFSSLRGKMLNQISTWFIQEACLGV